ncbi:MAG: MFS transporter [Acidobacteria bacterium]|nr:MFS transporter [Acidobacteriota bacterium]
MRTLGWIRLTDDRQILYFAAFLRAVATSMIGVLLGIYLARLRFNPAEAGIVVGAGLAGGAGAALLVTAAGDRIGRRRALVGLALTGFAGAALAATASHVIVMAAAAFVGMLNGMGRDRGASLILDHAVLPQTLRDETRTLGFAWYNVLQDVGHAAGALLAGLPVLVGRVTASDELLSFRVSVGVYALFVLLTAVLYWRLSRAADAPSRAPAVSVETRRVLLKISALFAVDSLGGGFLTASLLSFFFF